MPARPLATLRKLLIPRTGYPRPDGLAAREQVRILPEGNRGPTQSPFLLLNVQGLTQDACAPFRSLRPMGGRSSLREQPIVLSTAQRACAMLRSDGRSAFKSRFSTGPELAPSIRQQGA